MADSKQLSNFINGEFVAPTGGGYSDVINPSTGEAYLVGPDYLLRSSPRMFFENRDLYFEELKGGQTTEHDVEDIRPAVPSELHRPHHNCPGCAYR